MAREVPTSMKEAIAKAASGKRGMRLPHLSELAEHFIRLRGGPFKVAMMLSEEWDASDPGSIARTRIMDMLLRTWRFSQETAPSGEDMSLVSDDDLKQLLTEQLLGMEGLGEMADASP